jgi:hypothetical protein
VDPYVYFRNYSGENPGNLDDRSSTFLRLFGFVRYLHSCMEESNLTMKMATVTRRQIYVAPTASAYITYFYEYVVTW